MTILMPVNRLEAHGLNRMVRYYQATAATVSSNIVATGPYTALHADTKAVFVRLHAATHEVHVEIGGEASTDSPKLDHAVPIMIDRQRASATVATAAINFLATNTSQVLTVIECSV